MFPPFFNLRKSRYWLNSKIDNQEEYELQVKEICEIYRKTQELNTHASESLVRIIVEVIGF
jgi:hypothetical protein